MKILAWDIETSPHITYNYGLRNQNIGIGQIEKPSAVMCFAARWVGSPKNSIEFYSDQKDGHRKMVGQAWRLLDEADALLSWNGAGFDTQRMNTEFEKLHLGPPSEAKEIDLLKTARKRFGFASNKLDWVAQELDVGKKVKHDGISLWIRCMKGDPKAWAAFERYNKQDVHLLIDLYDRLLPWIPNHPNVNLYGEEKPRGYRACPKCGREGSLRKDGFRRTGIGKFQTYKCSACGSYSTDGTAVGRSEVRGL